MTDYLDLAPWYPADVSPPCAGLWTIFDSTHNDDRELAARMCADCPIRLDCYQQARKERTRHGVPVGTWGGVSFGVSGANTRDALDDRCGTTAGAKAHRRAGQEVCRDCLKAEQAARRRRHERERARKAAAA